MTRLFIFPLCFLFLFQIFSVSNAEESQNNYAGTSAILFPDTLSWTPLEKMRRPDKNYLQKNKKQLSKAYIVNQAHSYEKRSCPSFISTIFSSQASYSKYFRVHDVDKDGITDVLYTGDPICEEGNLTVIWYGHKNGFAIAKGIENILVLRVKEGPEINLSSVEVGCCTDMEDRYFAGSLYNNLRSRDESIVKTTQLPAKHSDKAVPFIAKERELILRSSPAVDNGYDENASNLNDRAIFGNIVTKYLPGCSGNIIGQHKGEDSKLWYFVILDDLCGSLRTHLPYSVTAGWIEAENIK